MRIENEGTSGKLIFYTRSDIAGPKQSDHTFTIVQNPKDLKETLSLALGVRGEGREKERKREGGREEGREGGRERERAAYCHVLMFILPFPFSFIGIVKKVRRLFMVGQTRVHIDAVEGLGDFMELEVTIHNNNMLFMLPCACSLHAVPILSFSAYYKLIAKHSSSLLAVGQRIKILMSHYYRYRAKDMNLLHLL